MTDIVVLRGSGANQGQDIIDPLLTSDHAAMARGRVALDEGSGLAPVSFECWYRDGLRLGQVIQVEDPFVGGLRFGKLVGISHNREGPSLYSTLRVMVPSRDAI